MISSHGRTKKIVLIPGELFKYIDNISRVTVKYSEGMCEAANY